MTVATRTTPDGTTEHRCACCWEWLPADRFGKLQKRPRSSARRSYCNPCRARMAREARREKEPVWL